jgi:hypothetical protein
MKVTLYNCKYWCNKSVGTDNEVTLSASAGALTIGLPNFTRCNWWINW